MGKKACEALLVLHKLDSPNGIIMETEHLKIMESFHKYEAFHRPKIKTKILSNYKEYISQENQSENEKNEEDEIKLNFKLISKLNHKHGKSSVGKVHNTL